MKDTRRESTGQRGHAQLTNGKATGDTTDEPFQILYLIYKNSLWVNLAITVGAVVIVFVQAHRNSPAISPRLGLAHI